MKKKARKELYQHKLIQAAADGNTLLIEECLANGADINADTEGDYSNSIGNVNDALGIALKNNQDKTAIYLIDQCLFGLEHVALAIEQKKYDFARLALIKMAATIHRVPDEIIEKNILNPIRGNTDSVCVSIINIINMEKKGIREKIIDFALSRKNSLSLTDEELIKQEPYLLHQYYSKGCCNNIPNTPLLSFILRDDTEISIKFINLDCEKKSIDIASECYMAKNSPLILAMKRGNTKIARALIDAGANVDCQDFRGFTPLHWACILRLDDMIELLLSHNANLKLKNAFGKQAIDYYLTEISTDDMKFDPTFAVKSTFDNDAMEEMNYYEEDVKFIKISSSYHKEQGKHCFATKVPDYSDLYWHIDGIFYNLAVDLPETKEMMKKDEQFNSRTRFFVEKRSQHPINQTLSNRLTAPHSLLVTHSFFKDEPIVDNRTGVNLLLSNLP